MRFWYFQLLQKEVGEGTTVQSVLANPNSWRGRAEQISVLQNKLSQLKADDTPPSRMELKRHREIKNMENNRKKQLQVSEIISHHFDFIGIRLDTVNIFYISCCIHSNPRTVRKRSNHSNKRLLKARRTMTLWRRGITRSVQKWEPSELRSLHWSIRVETTTILSASFLTKRLIILLVLA